MSNVQVETFYEADTGTCQHVVWDPSTSAAMLVDTVLDFDPAGGSTKTDSADKLIAFVKEKNLRVEYILETHAHADHLSAAPYLKEQLGSDIKIGIGKNITTVQGVFKAVYGFDDEQCPGDGSQFDVLFAEGDKFSLGSLEFEVWSTPGHTPACVSYVRPGDAAFVGDTIFMPDQGTARCDFPLGSSKTLWNSIQRLLSMPPETRILTCHDYGPGGREPQWETTVAAELEKNIHVKAGTEEAQFVAWRSERDAQLKPPRLIIPSVQTNINAGRFPSADSEGRVFLKTPINSEFAGKPEGKNGVVNMPGKL